MTDGQQLLVSHNYLRHLVKLANQKMEANWARIQRFHTLFAQQFLGDQLPGKVSGGKHSAQGQSSGEDVGNGCALEQAQLGEAPGKAEGAAQTHLYYVLEQGGTSVVGKRIGDGMS